MSKIILFASILLASMVSHADLSKTLVFSLNTIYLDRDYDDNGTTSESKITDTDLRLIRVDKKFAVGGIYSISSNDSSNSSRTSYGISAGYYSDKDFYLNAHYFLSSKYKFNGTTEYTKGSGYEIDLGFLSKITSSFYVGLMVAHKSFSYSEMTVNGVSSSTSATHKELIPMFTFAVVFM